MHTYFILILLEIMMNKYIYKRLNERKEKRIKGEMQHARHFIMVR